MSHACLPACLHAAIIYLYLLLIIEQLFAVVSQPAMYEMEMREKEGR